MSGSNTNNQPPGTANHSLINLEKSGAPLQAGNSKITVINDPAHPKDLILNIANKSQRISEANLEPLFKLSEIKKPLESKEKPGNTPHQPASIALQLLSQYGIKSAQDLISFIKSPAGKTVEKLKQEIMIDLLASIDNIRQQAIDSQTRRHRILAFLFLSMLYKKRAHAKKLNDFIRAQINEMLKENKKQAESTPVRSAEAQTYAAYGSSLEIISEILINKLTESNNLVSQLHTLEQQAELIRARYAAYASHIANLDQLYEQISLFSSELKKIDLLETRLASVNALIEAKQQEIDDFIIANEDELAANCLHELNGLNSEAIGIQDLIDVVKQDKLLYNAEGELADSFKDADYILSKTQKIVKENNNYYLLDATQDLNEMSPTEKAEAAQRFDLAKPNISGLKTLVHQNEELELDFHSKKLDKAMQFSDDLQKEITTLTSQSELIRAEQTVQAAQASTAALLQSPMATTDQIPTPRPISTGKAQNKPLSTTLDYRQTLDLIAKNPTEKGIQQLLQLFVQPDGKTSKEMQSLISRHIQPGIPIPPTTMNVLLATMARFSLNAYKENVTSRPAPLKENLHPRPTPFSIKPNPFN